jgi:hypothetical protein
MDNSEGYRSRTDDLPDAYRDALSVKLLSPLISILAYPSF